MRSRHDTSNAKTFLGVTSHLLIGTDESLPPCCHPVAQINAEKSPFLTDKLKVFMLPTLALIKNEKVEDYVVGFAVRGAVTFVFA